MYILLTPHERAHKGFTILSRCLVRLMSHAQQTAEAAHLFVDACGCAQAPKAEIPPGKERQHYANEHCQQGQR